MLYLKSENLQFTGAFKVRGGALCVVMETGNEEYIAFIR